MQIHLAGTDPTQRERDRKVEPGAWLNLNACPGQEELRCFCFCSSFFKLCNKLFPGDEFGLSKKRVYLRCHT